MTAARLTACLALLVAPASARAAAGQPNGPGGPPDSRARRSAAVGAASDTARQLPFRSAGDSADWARWRSAATDSHEFRVVVSLFDRELWVISGDDTLLDVPAAVASGLTLNYADRSWTFRTPRGRHEVLRKIEHPLWTPPDWLYAEVAEENGLTLARLRPGERVTLDDGSLLTVVDGMAGLIQRGTGEFVPLPDDEHIVFGDTLYIPPFGTDNRRVPGELGQYALDLGDGYLIHGTPEKDSIGHAVTHGCIRLRDDDIAWVYRYVPVGTPVFIY